MKNYVRSSGRRLADRTGFRLRWRGRQPGADISDDEEEANPEDQKGKISRRPEPGQPTSVGSCDGSRHADTSFSAFIASSACSIEFNKSRAAEITGSSTLQPLSPFRQ
jgi:hypothetical protein